VTNTDLGIPLKQVDCLLLYSPSAEIDNKKEES